MGRGELPPTPRQGSPPAGPNAPVMKLTTHPVPRVPPMSLEAFHEQWLRPRRPVIIEGALDDWPARHNLSLQGFRECWGDREARLNNSIPGAATMRFADYIDAIVAGKAAGLYLDATPVAWLDGLSDTLRVPPWIPSDRTLQTLVWVGPAGTVLPFHKDNQSPLDGNHNLFAQFVGRKRFLLVSPSDEPFMYPLPLEPGRYAKSAVDLRDLGKSPDFVKATVLEALLGPGDLLFNPAHWWHHVESLDPSISVSFWWRASRLIETLRTLRAKIQLGMAEAWLARHRESIHLDDVHELGGPDTLQAMWSTLTPQARQMCDALLDAQVLALVASP